jgi:hypothetical protein
MAGGAAALCPGGARTTSLPPAVHTASTYTTPHDWSRDRLQSERVGRPARNARSGRASIVWANGVERLASPGLSGSVMTLPLVVAVVVDQSRSPALADIIGARRARTA